MATPNKVDTSIKRTALRLVMAGTLMFGFGFALVPLYDVFCDLTGLNGKIDNVRYSPVEGEQVVNLEREVNVQFVALNHDSVSWEFKPNLVETEMNPGAVVHTSYYVRNTSGRDMTVQAVPSISPGQAAKYVRKMECFCFERQHLAKHESMDMPLRFELDPDIPEEYGQITLSYTLFDVSETDVN